MLACVLRFSSVLFWLTLYGIRDVIEAFEGTEGKIVSYLMQRAQSLEPFHYPSSRRQSVSIDPCFIPRESGLYKWDKDPDPYNWSVSIVLNTFGDRPVISLRASHNDQVYWTWLENSGPTRATNGHFLWSLDWGRQKIHTNIITDSRNVIQKKHLKESMLPLRITARILRALVQMARV